jgi:hypothetical protein
MTVRELLARLTSHAMDGRGSDEEVAVLCDGGTHHIETIETRLASDGDERPRATFVLLITAVV